MSRSRRTVVELHAHLEFPSGLQHYKFRASGVFHPFERAYWARGEARPTEPAHPAEFEIESLSIFDPGTQRWMCWPFQLDGDVWGMIAADCVDACERGDDVGEIIPAGDMAAS